MSVNKEPFSYHVFLFPFKWDYFKNAINDKENNLTTRTSLKEFHELLSTNDQWSSEEYKLKNSLDYNEYTYFYDFVRDAIFDTEFDKNKKDKILNHYSFNLPNKNVKYSIKLFGKEKEEEKYKLDVKDIYLHVYSTGVALLSFHLENNEKKHSSFEDILKINEYGRRIYPQFLDATQPFVEKTKKAFLADEIEIVGVNNTKEDFSYFNNYFGNINTNKSFRLPNFISTLLGDNFVTETNSQKIKISPLVDDRMFVISWYGNTILVNKLQTFDKQTNNYNFLNSDNWYKYIFVDTKDTSCKNNIMKYNQLEYHSYARWVDDNYERPQIYGITRYSFVALTNSGESFIVNHLKTMYYQMVVLSLIQRASILRFSDEVKEISKLDNKDDNQLQEIKSLNKAYLKFTNQMYFREVTAQEQGIELYDMIQQHMRIERDVKDLNREIDELYQFAKLLEDEKERKQMNRLQKWGAVLLIPTMIAGIFGMNTVTRHHVSFWGDAFDINFIISVIFICIVAIIAALFFFRKNILNRIIRLFQKVWKNKSSKEI